MGSRQGWFWVCSLDWACSWVLLITGWELLVPGRMLSHSLCVFLLAGWVFLKSRWMLHKPGWCSSSTQISSSYVDKCFHFCICSSLSAGSPLFSGGLCSPRVPCASLIEWYSSLSCSSFLHGCSSYLNGARRPRMDGPHHLRGGFCILLGWLILISSEFFLIPGWGFPYFRCSSVLLPVRLAHCRCRPHSMPGFSSLIGLVIKTMLNKNACIIGLIPQYMYVLAS